MRLPDHLPVINYSRDSDSTWRLLAPVFSRISLAMTGMRVLIAWIYTNTESVLLAQLMHVSSTVSVRANTWLTD